MKLTQLPPVAKSFVTYCARCEADRFHTVLAHISADSAKVVCDVCKKKSTFSLKADTSKKLKSPSSGLSRPVRLSSSQNKEAPESFTATKLNHRSVLAEQYESLKQQKDSVPPRPYRATESYQNGDKLEHKSFGLGFVLKVKEGRMDVLFADAVRQLVCASSANALPL
jgi:hypothetical protein